VSYSGDSVHDGFDDVEGPVRWAIEEDANSFMELHQGKFRNGN